ncbi:MAG: DUF3226 domain-containing protein [Campylobacterota bacterium]|nr:DUF3226 domain-containing protein [Campylobacterota bacterium]
MKYLLVEGITDVKFVQYICFKNNIIKKFDDFEKQKAKTSQIEVYKYNDLYILNMKSQDNLEYALSNTLKPMIKRIKKIGIIEDADDNFEESTTKITDAIKKSQIDESNISYFLTPNNKDLGDLETLLLSTIKENNIVQCFDDYKKCLLSKEEIHPKALNKGQIYAYTMYSQQGENLHKPQHSFMFEKDKIYADTNLWDLKKDEFEPITDFILEIFKKDS